MGMVSVRLGPHLTASLQRVTHVWNGLCLGYASNSSGWLLVDEYSPKAPALCGFRWLA